MLIIRHIRHWYEPRLPHAVFLDGLYAGMVGKDDSLRLDAPHGNYTLKIQLGGRVPIGKNGRSIDVSVSTTKHIEVPANGNVEYAFRDRERMWNILFDIDLVMWVVSWFVPMPRIYKILSDAFFVMWLVRFVLIRKKYYKIETIQQH